MFCLMMISTPRYLTLAWLEFSVNTNCKPLLTELLEPSKSSLLFFSLGTNYLRLNLTKKENEQGSLQYKPNCHNLLLQSCLSDSCSISGQHTCFSFRS